MADFVEREKILEAISDIYKDADSAVEDACIEIWSRVKEIPAADVRPVVLCRDCKRYGGRPWENKETGICARTDCGVGEDDFCSYGEKQEES